MDAEPFSYAGRAAIHHKTNWSSFLQHWPAMDEGSSNNRPQSLETLERTMAASYGVIGGLLVFGTIGYFLDRWLHTSPWLFAMGLIGGVAVPLFGLRRLISTC